MAKLPPLRRLLLEDFSTQKAWIGTLLLVINNFMEAVVSAVNKNLTIVENTTGDIKMVTLSGTLPVSVAWAKSLPPTAVFVGNVSLVGGATVSLTTAIGITWSMSTDGKSLQVNSVVGVTPSSTQQYILTLLCIQG